MKKQQLRFHKVLILLGIAYLIFLAGIYLLQEKIIFLPSSEIFLEINTEIAGAEEFNLEINAQATIHGYFFATENSKGTIVFFHGNGGNLTNNYGRVAIAQKMGYNIAVFDYRGYGQSIGEINSEEDLYQDAEIVYNYLIEDKKIPRNSIIFWGQSLGGAIAMEMAKRHPAKKLILESTFSSLANITPNVFKYGVPDFLKKYKFNSLEKFAGIVTPILVIHSSEDEMIDYKNGQDLFARNSTKDNQFLEIKGGHNGGFYENFEKNEKTIKEFLEK